MMTPRPGTGLETKTGRTIRGLYAVTPDDADTARLIIRVRAALEGGAAVLQYRNKSADRALRHKQAGALAILCRQHGVPFIINDHLELALDVGADGLHLGADDGDIAAARRALGADRLLGASCYNRFELALAARDAGADHVAFGAACVSSTKPDAVHAPLALYRREEYAKAGVPMLPVTHGEKFTRLNLLLYTIILVACSLLPFTAKLSGLIYLVAALALGAGLWVRHKLRQGGQFLQATLTVLEQDKQAWSQR